MEKLTTLVASENFLNKVKDLKQSLSLSGYSDERLKNMDTFFEGANKNFISDSGVFTSFKNIVNKEKTSFNFIRIINEQGEGTSLTSITKNVIDLTTVKEGENLEFVNTNEGKNKGFGKLSLTHNVNISPYLKRVMSKYKLTMLTLPLFLEQNLTYESTPIQAYSFFPKMITLLNSEGIPVLKDDKEQEVKLTSKMLNLMSLKEQLSHCTFQTFFNITSLMVDGVDILTDVKEDVKEVEKPAKGGKNK